MSIYVLSACTSRYETTGENHYTQSTNGPHLIVPPPLNSAMISHFYDLPPQTQNPTVSIIPPVV